jgi:hypothetical protein
VVGCTLQPVEFNLNRRLSDIKAGVDVVTTLIPVSEEVRGT